jgi:hypothetical protein
MHLIENCGKMVVLDKLLVILRKQGMYLKQSYYVFNYWLGSRAILASKDSTITDEDIQTLGKKIFKHLEKAEEKTKALNERM